MTRQSSSSGGSGLVVSAVVGAAVAFGLFFLGGLVPVLGALLVLLAVPIGGLVAALVHGGGTCGGFAAGAAAGALTALPELLVAGAGVVLFGGLFGLASLGAVADAGLGGLVGGVLGLVVLAVLGILALALAAGFNAALGAVGGVVGGALSE